MILDVILLIVEQIMKFDNGINNKTCWAATIIGDNIALRLADDNRNIDADNDFDNEINNENYVTTDSDDIRAADEEATVMVKLK